MIVVGGENLIDYVQVSEGGDLPVYRAIPARGEKIGAPKEP